MAWRRAGEPTAGRSRAAIERRPAAADGTRIPPVANGPGQVAAGVITGRRGFSPSRAVIGAVLVAAAAVVVFAAALSAAGGHQSGYAVAARPLPAGSIIGPGDVTTARMGLPGPVSAGAFRRPDSLVGRTLAVSVAPGQLLEAPMLADDPSARLRPVSIPVDTDSLAALAPGQEVDVLATTSSSASSGPSSASVSPASPAGASPASGPAVLVILRGATLESVARTGSGLLSGTTGASTVVTLGVSDLDEVEMLVQAAHTGTVELVRAEPSDGSGPDLPAAASSAAATGTQASPGGS